MKLYRRRRGTNQYRKQDTFLEARMATWRSARFILVMGFLLLTVLVILRAYVYEPIKDRLFPSVLLSPISMTVWADTINTSAYMQPVFTSQEQNKILSYKHGDILWRIYTLESSRGKHGFLYCQKKGLKNDFGMGVLNNPPMCFVTLDDELTYVSRWLDKQLAVMPLNQVLCYYNQGIKESSCEYSRDFMNL